MSESLEHALAETEFIDHTSAEVKKFVAGVLPDGGLDERDRAVRLYYAVRDKIGYEIYGADFSRRGLTAGQTLRLGRGMCIHKSLVYLAALRSVGIPGRLVLTDVRNHLASERLRTYIGGDVFHYHALTSVHLDGRWVRATPVFNRILCKLYGMAPLEFDGTADSVHHPYTGDGARNMEFLHEHGEFDDLPYQLVLDGMRSRHPGIIVGPDRDRFAPGSLVADATGGTA
ncbi:transglutaminase family protein [Kitasatospora aureofaciens]|uniref:transglutaminase-like domain-containing protein n=1 Tax=Kitasatospora aureofaciens TaxID=1894 RepID=UPI001C45417E|nr:transglutaminase-like domain-containing protein [Kitasatospora aureofaciens]MBV6699349.1 transglutaminase-like domain-containing protein [Kitasatospora aureofaciens]